MEINVVFGELDIRHGMASHGGLWSAWQYDGLVG